MQEFLTYKHSFNSGDLVTVLPGIRNLWKKTGKKAIIYQRLDMPADYGHNDNHPIKSDDGRMVCMNMKMFKLLQPLIQNQEYVERFEVWHGESVDFDFDLTRINSRMPLPGGSIHHWPFLIFPQLECELSEPWIDVHKQNAYRNLIIVNRTERYQNPYIDYFFLKDYQHNILFAGLGSERDIFCEKYGLNIGLLSFGNFFDLASIMKSARCFIGNQSMCWHIADAMKIPRILEVCTEYPNTFPTGANGNSFVVQNALEYQFQELLKTTNA